jgi:hypothetical protein
MPNHSGSCRRIDSACGAASACGPSITVAAMAMLRDAQDAHLVPARVVERRAHRAARFTTARTPRRAGAARTRSGDATRRAVPTRR